MKESSIEAVGRPLFSVRLIGNVVASLMAQKRKNGGWRNASLRLRC